MSTVEQDRCEHARENAKGWLASIEEMVEFFENSKPEGREANYTRDYEEAERTIHESVLSVRVRSGWYMPGSTVAQFEEFEILLTTGGPALRIIGGLDCYGEPISAELQMQDWGMPWTRYPASEATLLAFACCFYFGG
jgi:hypothetical protein